MLNENSLDIIPTKAMLLKQNNINNEFKTIIFKEKKKTYNTTKVKEKNNFLNRSKNNESLNNEDSNDTYDLNRKFSKIPTKRNIKRKDDREMDMKRARYDVINFGISGFGTKDKEKAKIELAIKLGAKPPKNKYRNYKEMIEEKKETKLKEKEENNYLKLGKNSTGAATQNFKKSHKKFTKNMKKRQSGVLEHYGVVNPKIGKK